ncbi:MAG: aminoglycoside phosphotransferase family protein [Chloroflexota bacterium]|nr:aminoglycoside phosphotransferase family protein [Chloroflexota bacterium]
MTKEAELVERRVLALLTAQGQPNVPFSHSADLTTDSPALVCLQDLGDVHLPTVLDSITLEAIRREAHGLALIHHANRGRADDLAWLPRADRAYIAGAIMETYGQPAWSQALADPAFERQFAPYIAAVEDAAARIADEMDALDHNDAARTLIHGDINPSNVLLHAGMPYFIDWQAARYGSFYLDLPHQLHTRDLAESYRAARAALGDEIPADEFGACLRVAAQYIGLRYM